MRVNDNFSQSDKQSPENSRECCCSPAPGGNRGNWRALILVVVLAAAGIVLAQSLARKSNAAAEQPQPQQAGILTIATPETADATEPALWGPELDSLAALDEVATDADTVFILICSRDQQDTQTIISEIEAATKNIRSRGNRASAFRLRNGTVDYGNIAEQFSVPTVLAMVKGFGYSAVSEQITEANLVEAFVTASKAQPACCPPGTDPSQCAPSDSN